MMARTCRADRDLAGLDDGTDTIMVMRCTSLYCCYHTLGREITHNMYIMRVSDV